MSKKRYLVVFFISLLAISMLSMSVSALLLPDGSYCTYKSQCQSGFCVHNVCRSSSPYCGDKYCDYGENCGTCSGDCGCGAGKECINSECKISDGYYCYYYIH